MPRIEMDYNFKKNGQFLTFFLVSILEKKISKNTVLTEEHDVSASSCRHYQMQIIQGCSSLSVKMNNVTELNKNNVS